MKLIRFWYFWLAFLALPLGTLAHPLDVYLQATLIDIKPGEIRLQINLTPGVEVADKVIALMDRNKDGVISTNESAAYAELVKSQLVARLDGRDAELRLAASDFPEPADLRTGWGIIQMEYIVTTGALASGPHQFTLENRHQPVKSAYLFNAAQPGTGFIKITSQKRVEDQSNGEIDFEYHPPLNLFRVGGVIVSLTVLFLVLFVSARQEKKNRSALFD